MNIDLGTAILLVGLTWACLWYKNKEEERNSRK